MVPLIQIPRSLCILYMLCTDVDKSDWLTSEPGLEFVREAPAGYFGPEIRLPGHGVLDALETVRAEPFLGWRHGDLGAKAADLGPETIGPKVVGPKTFRPKATLVAALALLGGTAALW